MIQRERLKEARDFAVYYGSGLSDTLKAYDIAIIEPAGHDETDLRAMQEAGTLVLAYLSVMEINHDMPEFRLLRNEDFLEIDGERVINKEYGNFLLDLSSRRWINLLVQKAVRLMGKAGYDGLFLDTIGDVEEPGWPGPVRDAQLLAAVNVVSELRQLWPHHILVQNCGLERLVSLTAGLVDGVCWENPPLLASAVSWVETVAARLAGLRQEFGLQTLVLAEALDRNGALNTAARRIAADHGFLFYQAPRNYLSIRQGE